jgi:hypothetical protein
MIIYLGSFRSQSGVLDRSGGGLDFSCIVRAEIDRITGIWVVGRCRGGGRRCAAEVAVVAAEPACEQYVSPVTMLM